MSAQRRLRASAWSSSRSLRSSPDVAGRIGARRRPEPRTSSPRSRRGGRSSAMPSSTTRRNRSASMAPRAATETKCQPNQMTAQEVTGFDVETTKLVAQRLGRGGVLRLADLHRGRQRALGRPPRHRLCVGGDQRHPDGAPLDDPALLLHPAGVRRPRGLAVPDACRPRRQDDRHVQQLHGRVVPQGNPRDPRRRARPEGEGPASSRASRPSSRAWMPSPPATRRLPHVRAGRRMQAIEEGKPLRILDEPAFSMYPSGFVDKKSGLVGGGFRGEGQRDHRPRPTPTVR